MSEDPLGFGGGDTNTYTYPQNNPVLFRDPSGEQFFGPGVPGPVLLKPIESPLLRAAAIGGMLSAGLAQIGAGVVTTVAGVASIPETGPAGLIVAGAGVVVTSGGVAMIGGALWAIPHLFPEIADCPRPKSDRRPIDNPPLPNPTD